MVGASDVDFQVSGDGRSKPNKLGWAIGEMLPTLLPTPAVNDMGEGKTLEWWDDWAPRQKAADGRPAPHGRSLAIEAQTLIDKWVSTGLVQSALEAIRTQVFNVAAPVAP